MNLIFLMILMVYLFVNGLLLDYTNLIVATYLIKPTTIG
jgi:hypothetical protein